MRTIHAAGCFVHGAAVPVGDPTSGRSRTGRQLSGRRSSGVVDSKRIDAIPARRGILKAGNEHE
jgi:hypothetical protein